MQSGYDSLSLTGQIVASLKGAGWIIQNWPTPIGITLADGLRVGELAGTEGVAIEIPQSKRPALEAPARALGGALSGMGVDAVVNATPDAGYGDLNIVHILVGAKPTQ